MVAHLDGVEVAVVEEDVCHDLPPVGVVAEDEEGPVHQPAALLQLHDCGRRRARLDRVTQRLDVLDSLLPVLHEDLARELTPHGREGLVGVGRQRAHADEQARGLLVLATVVDELGVPAQHVRRESTAGARVRLALIRSRTSPYTMGTPVQHVDMCGVTLTLTLALTLALALALALPLALPLRLPLPLPLTCAARRRGAA